MGNLQKQVRAAGRRLEAARLCQQGVSNEEIAKKLGIGEVTVAKCLRRFLESDSRYPVGINATQVELMRAEERQMLESHRQRLLARAHHLSKRLPYSMEEECMLAAAECKINDSLVKNSERIASMYGLDPPRPQASPMVNITNNTIAVLSSPAIERLKARRLAQSQPVTETPAVELSSAD
jgi:transposase-like protein